MVLRRFLIVIISLMLIIPVNLVFIPSFISASPQPDDEDEKPPVSGSGYSEFKQDWYVDTGETLYYGNQTINLTGDLVINGTGKLILYNVTLQFNNTSDAQYGITVEDNGILEATSTTITCLNNMTYTFKIYGNLSLDTCEVSRLYMQDSGSGPIGGVEIHDGNATINNSLFHSNLNNFYLSTPADSKIKITNNTMTDPLKDMWNFTDCRGIIILDQSRPYIYNNDIKYQLDGIAIAESGSAVIDNNRITRSEDVGIYVETGGSTVIITNNIINYSDTYDAIWVEDPSTLLIENNTLHHCRDSGVWYASSQKSTIKNNHMFNNDYGMYIDSSTSWVYGNTMDNNLIVGLYIALSQPPPNPVIERNEIHHNAKGPWSDGYGVYIDSSSGRITNNNIHHNGPLTGASGPFQGGGIFVSSQDAPAIPRIDNNTINYNDRNGIDVDSQSKAEIYDNTVEHNNGTGIFITQAGNVIPSGNTIRYNRNGIHYVKNSGHIVHNTISDNLDFGILLQENSGPIIYDNEISHNGNDSAVDAGVYMDGSAGACNARLKANEISNNTGPGVKVHASTPTIEYNYIDYNNKGVTLSSSSSIIRFNNINYNTETGIISKNSGTVPQITANTVDGNDIGIHIFDNSRPNLIGNWFRSNDRGIFIDGWSWPTLDNNVVSTNRIGLNIEYSTLTIKHMTFESNTEVAVDVLGTNFTLDNSSISNSGVAGVRLDDNSHLTMLNTTFSKNKVTFTDARSEIKPYWYLNLKLEDNLGNPLVNGWVEVRNSTGKISFGRIVPPSGSFEYIKLKEYSEFSSGRYYTTPHTVYAEKVDYIKLSQTVTMDKSKSMKLSLGPNFQPGKVTNIQPRQTHNLTPLITWTPAVDPDGDLITYVLNIGTTLLGSNIVNSTQGKTTEPKFQVTDPLSFGDGNTSYYLTVYAYDGKGGESMEQHTMFVINHRPETPKIEIVPTRPNRLTGITCRVTRESTDGDNDTLTYEYRWYKNGQLDTNITQLGTTELSSSVPAEFTEDGQTWKCYVRAFDGHFYSPAAESKQVTVKNFAPRLNDTPFEITIMEDSIAENAFNLMYVFVDDNNETLKYSWNTSKYVQVIENGTWITFKPMEDWFGEAKFRFTAKDLFTEINFDVTVTVKSVNDPPVLDPIGDLEINEDEWFNVTFKAFDHADNDMIFYYTNITAQITGLLADINYRFSLNTGELNLKPDNSMVGTYRITITVEDENKGKDSETIILTIKNVNDRPTAIINSPLQDIVYTTGELIKLNGSKSFDEDSLFGDRITSARWTAGGEVINNSLVGSYRFKKAGTYMITLELTDDNGATGSASVSITVKKAPEDAEESLIDTISENPAAVAGISIVVIIVVLIVLMFIFMALRARKERKMMVEAGLLTEDDLKKAREMPEVPPGGGGMAVQFPPGQMPPPGTVPQPMGMPVPAPVPLEGQEELAALPPAEGPSEGVTPVVKEVTAEEAKGPQYGPAIRLDTLETPDEAPTRAPEVEGEDELEGEGAETGQTAAVAEAKPVQTVVQGVQVTRVQPQMPPQMPAQQPMPPVYPGMPMMPQVQCPDCGSPAQFHPMNRKIIICPVCGPMKTE